MDAVAVDAFRADTQVYPEYYLLVNGLFAGQQGILHQ